MKRPLGVSLTSIWLVALVSALAVLAIVSGELPAALFVASVAAMVFYLSRSLWIGQAWARRVLIAFLLLSSLVSLWRVLVPGSKQAKPLYYAGRAVTMAVWCAYFFTPRAREFFDPRQAPEPLAPAPQTGA